MSDVHADRGMVVRQEVGLDLALAMLAGVREEAEARSVAMGAAVVDLGGRVVAALRMDGAQLPALDLAIDKAYTAVSFGHPTEFWAASTRPGRLGLGPVDDARGADRRVRGRPAGPCRGCARRRPGRERRGERGRPGMRRGGAARGRSRGPRVRAAGRAAG
jgi:hypothetical protein